MTQGLRISARVCSIMQDKEEVKELVDRYLKAHNAELDDETKDLFIDALLENDPNDKPKQPPKVRFQKWFEDASLQDIADLVERKKRND